MAVFFVGFALGQAEIDTLLFQDFEAGMGEWITYIPQVHWHLTDVRAYEGDSWWCGDDELDGYTNEWLQWLVSPDIDLPAAPAGSLMLSVMVNYSIEAPATYDVYDGWDGFNVRISTDGGATFTPIEPIDGYPCTSMYGFGYNGEGPGIPGWGGSSDGWVEKSFNLSGYAGATVQIAFVFGSDPAFCTTDDPSLFGVLVDNIAVYDDADTFFFDDAGDSAPTEMTPHDGLELYNLPFEVTDVESHSPTHSAHAANTLGDRYSLISPVITIPDGFLATITYWVYCDLPDYDGDDDGYLEDFYQVQISTDDGATWEWLTSDYARGSSATGWSPWTNDSLYTGTLNLYDYMGADVRIRFVAINDDNDDGGTGSGLFLDDICVSGFYGSSYDAGVSNIFTGPINLDQDIIFTAAVTGYGVETVNPTVYYKIFTSDDSVVTMGLLGSATVGFGESRHRNFTWRPTDPGDYYVLAWTTLTGDEDGSNDTCRLDFTVPTEAYRELGFDDGVLDTFYSSSGAGPYLFINPSIDTIPEVEDGFAVDFSCPFDETHLQSIAFRGSGFGGVVFSIFELTPDGPDFMPVHSFEATLPEEGLDTAWFEYTLEDDYIIPFHDFLITVWAADTSSWVLVCIDKTAPHDGHSWVVDPELDFYDFFDLSTASAPYNEMDLMIRCKVWSPGGVAEKLVPGWMTLYQNVPNPFNASTEIRFSLPEDGNASLVIYDLLGKAVRTLVSGPCEAGVHRVVWDGRDDAGNPVPSGVYIYRLTAGEESLLRRMMLVR